jgi:hypothetical protein
MTSSFRFHDRSVPRVTVCPPGNLLVVWTLFPPGREVSLFLALARYCDDLIPMKAWSIHQSLRSNIANPAPIDENSSAASHLTELNRPDRFAFLDFSGCIKKMGDVLSSHNLEVCVHCLLRLSGRTRGFKLSQVRRRLETNINQQNHEFNYCRYEGWPNRFLSTFSPSK